MDKKNLILGIGFICAAFASLYVGQALSPKPPATAPAVREAVGQTAANPANAPAAPATAGAPSQPPTLSAGGPSASFASATGANANAANPNASPPPTAQAPRTARRNLQLEKAKERISLLEDQMRAMQLELKQVGILAAHIQALEVKLALVAN